MERELRHQLESLNNMPVTMPQPPSSPSGLLSRRAFVTAGVSAAAYAWLVGTGCAARTGLRFSAYPFSLGIASGDPAPDGFVLWTRLAPQPLEPGGGMDRESVPVHWMVAEDESFKRIVQQGTALAESAWAHSVHVEVAGLKPDRWYWYRFTAGGATSPVGRTRTFPAPGALPAKLSFAFASCQKYEVGYYTAYEHMAREDLDLVVHLGDYIYEKGDSKSEAVRPHGQAEVLELDDYRKRYAIYKSDPALQAMHAAAPWVVTWDDHEVNNNYAGAVSEDPTVDRAAFLRRRAAGYRAYYEHLPLRRSALPAGPDMLLYRRLEFGRLASFNVLDTRQYRTDQPLGDGFQPPSPVLLDPHGTILGEQQRKWLLDGLDHSPATWNVLAQQVMMARNEEVPGAERAYHMDKWTGYEYERQAVLRHLRERAIANPVVITGDIHTNWANELGPDADRPDDAAVAVEFVGTSISSGGDEAKPGLDAAVVRAENPWVKFFNDERGYVRCEVTPEAWRADYRTVAYVSRPGAPVRTAASFVVNSGRPILEPA
ncbi:MAG: alkaline phosphatase D family protein [Cephaloticoccus sp.]|nr:alkaline phosphatase D family protein [Cephaloticoccus sp.]